MRCATFFATVIVQCNGKSFYQLRHCQLVGRVPAQQVDRFAMSRSSFIFLVNFGNWIVGDWNDFCYQLFLWRSMRLRYDFGNGQIGFNWLCVFLEVN